jgi:hypothetical protein
MFHGRYPLGKICSVVVGNWIAHDEKEFPWSRGHYRIRSSTA